MIIENNNSSNSQSLAQEQQDDIDLQITICVLILSGIFLICNIPNFTIFSLRFVSRLSFTRISFIFVYLSLLPLLIAHTITYFIFNHLAARLFPTNNSS